jgi:Transcriptional Coactivator p15 (PC4)
MPKKANKTYNLGENRVLSTRKEVGELVISIKDTSDLHKFVDLPAQRWLSFVFYQSDIDESVRKLELNQDVKFFQHIGGGWYISVTTGFMCVDIRRFYFAKGELKPLKKGIALRLSEWETLKPVMQSLPTDVPQLASIQLCFMRDDHLNQEGYLQCRECCPFGEDFFSQPQST